MVFHRYRVSILVVCKKFCKNEKTMACGV